MATNPPKADTKASTKSVAGFKIASIQEHGRHRAGRFWPQEATTVAASEFTEEQIELLKGDKKLMVFDIDLPSDAVADGAPKT